MDADVKRKNAQVLDCGAPPALRPLTLSSGPGEVLDLTYSPPPAFPPPTPFTFPPLAPREPVATGAQLLGMPELLGDPSGLLNQRCDINFKEVLEEMLRSLHTVPPTEPPGGQLGAMGAGEGPGGGPERQSVIQFSPHFPNS